ncbi:MAG: hypothetical protein ACFFFB_08240 [Candidatus Heimdallarchaeota archaeon]
MVKKFVGFILMGVAAGNFVVSIILFFTYNSLLDFIGFPDYQKRILIISILVSSLIPAIVLLIVGIVVLIKASKQEKQRTLKDQKDQS